MKIKLRYETEIFKKLKIIINLFFFTLFYFLFVYNSLLVIFLFSFMNNCCLPTCNKNNSQTNKCQFCDFSYCSSICKIKHWFIIFFKKF